VAQTSIIKLRITSDVGLDINNGNLKGFGYGFRINLAVAGIQSPIFRDLSGTDFRKGFSQSAKTLTFIPSSQAFASLNNVLLHSSPSVGDKNLCGAENSLAFCTHCRYRQQIERHTSE
jgi:hypothetical protein